MPNDIRIKRGNLSTLPILNDGELAYVKDEKELYVGDGTSNIKLLKAIKDFCRKVNVTAENITTTTQKKIPMNNDSQTTNADMNIVDGIKIVNDGLYILNVESNIVATSATGNVVAGIHLNNNSFLNSTYNFTNLATEYKSLNLTQVLYLTKDDTLYVNVANNTDKTIQFVVTILTATQLQ